MIYDIERLRKSRNSPKTKSPFSKQFHILSKIHDNANSREWSHRNPNWYEYNNLCMFMKDNNRVYIKRLYLKNNGNTITGLYLENDMGSFALNRGITFISGVNTPSVIDIFNIFESITIKLVGVPVSAGIC